MGHSENCQPQNPGPRFSKLAIISLAVVSLGWIIIGPMAIPLGLVLAIAALVRIRLSKGELKGSGFAVSGIVVSIAWFGLVIFVLGQLFGGFGLSKQEPGYILAQARLSSLPRSATDIKAEGWHSLFAGDDYLMFRAEPDDINDFIAGSASLEKIEPEIYSPAHQRIPYPDEPGNGFPNEAGVRHDYYRAQMDDLVPQWYKPTIKVRGRKYDIPGAQASEGYPGGTVIIDDETNTVYINGVW